MFSQLTAKTSPQSPLPPLPDEDESVPPWPPVSSVAEPHCSVQTPQGTCDPVLPHCCTWLPSPHTLSTGPLSRCPLGWMLSGLLRYPPTGLKASSSREWVTEAVALSRLEGYPPLLLTPTGLSEVTLELPSGSFCKFPGGLCEHKQCRSTEPHDNTFFIHWFSHWPGCELQGCGPQGA